MQAVGQLRGGRVGVVRHRAQHVRAGASQYGGERDQGSGGIHGHARDVLAGEVDRCGADQDRGVEVMRSAILARSIARVDLMAAACGVVAMRARSCAVKWIRRGNDRPPPSRWPTLRTMPGY
ncbi:hypothetical protein AT728_24650 [Streptomyces silvensis]|uniref:Uncharacterized protein n=1 Tax=Streptomyces silvensis TaxID=1765722 RepID=A0A0W7X5J0_9ACTN|nr:hypothetical protein AT728_24650 [Streptomyces silvensis]